MLVIITKWAFDEMLSPMPLQREDLAEEGRHIVTAMKQEIKRNVEAFLIRHSKLFDEEYYRTHSTNPPAKEEDAVVHYMDGGWRTGDPSAFFQNENYRVNNEDVRENDLCPLAHYLTYGRLERRKYEAPAVIASRMGKYYSHRVCRAILRVICRERGRNLIRENSSARILVCIQLFYPHAWKEIREYIKNLSPYHFDLLITYVDLKGFEKTTDRIRAEYPKAILKPVANLGFDVGAFCGSLQGVDLDRYDLVFKMHSKGTARPEIYIYHQYMKKRDWFLYLFGSLMGANQIHRNIYRMLQDPTVGMTAPENLIVQDPRHKRELVRREVQKVNLKIEIPEEYFFVAGTCFIIRADLLKWIQSAELSFQESRRQTFSLAHAIERVMCIGAQSEGRRIVGVPSHPLRQKLRKKQEGEKEQSVMDELLSDNRFLLDPEFCYFALEMMRISKYEIVEIPLGSILRRWFDGKYYKLKDCAPYRYLMGDDETYEEYSRYHNEHDLTLMTRERFQELIESIEEKGYDERHILVVDQKNVIMDGQHRACILLAKYGEEHKVNVLKIWRDDLGRSM